jgi:SOS-response transcriptional repressor LexA
VAETTLTLGQYLKKMRTEKGMTLRELYKASGVSNGYISQLENETIGKNGKPISPTIDVIAKLAKALQIPLGQFLLESGQVDNWDYNGLTPEKIAEITADYLRASGLKLDLDDEKSLKDFTEYLAKTKQPNNLTEDNYTGHNLVYLYNQRAKSFDRVLKETPTVDDIIPVSDFIKVPIIGVVRAGVGGFACEEFLGNEYVEKKDLNCQKLDSYFWLRVKGDSMQPEIYAGDLALVCKQPDVESGQLAVVIVNGEEGVIKRVHKSNGGIVLQSVNSSYSPRIFTGQDMENIKIVGKVIEIKRKF